jgi:hypothetical protein
VSSVRANSGKLFWDFRVQGVRCRGYIALPDTKDQRPKMQRVLDKIDAEIGLPARLVNSHLEQRRVRDGVDDHKIELLLEEQTIVDLDRVASKLGTIPDKRLANLLGVAGRIGGPLAAGAAAVTGSAVDGAAPPTQEEAADGSPAIAAAVPAERSVVSRF